MPARCPAGPGPAARSAPTPRGVPAPGGVPAPAADRSGPPQGAVYDVDYYGDREHDRFAVEDVVLHKAGEEDAFPPGERARLDSLTG